MPGAQAVARTVYSFPVLGWMNGKQLPNGYEPTYSFRLLVCDLTELAPAAVVEEKSARMDSVEIFACDLLATTVSPLVQETYSRLI